MSKRIALFGGSFNPPHEGHREIVRRLARRKGVDEVWVIPVFKHPFRKKLAPFSLRIRLLRRMLRGIGPKVKILGTEKRLGGVSWTYRLVDYLKRRHPKVQFYWALGADTYRQRRLWKNWRDIEKTVTFIVFPRGRGSPIPDVSSRKMRRKLKKGVHPPKGPIFSGSSIVPETRSLRIYFRPQYIRLLAE